MTNRNRLVGVAALAAFALTVVAANAALDAWGFVAVGFGLTAPAGVYFAGAAFTFRDVGHDHLGPWPVLGAIAVGALLSAVVDPALAVASAAAFTFAELADLAVYSPLRSRGWTVAVVASGLVGAVVDSILFLWLAPFPATAEGVAGLVVGKAWIIAATVLVLAPARSRRPMVAA